MAICTVEIQDEVNIRIYGLDPDTLDQVIQAMSFHVPNYMFTPAYKLGRWKSGKIALCKRSGKTFLNLFEKVAGLIEQAGYKFSVQDNRRLFEAKVEKIGNNLFEGLRAGQFHGIMEEHQVAAINAIIANQGGILELATASGKTVITAALAKLYSPFGKVLIIVPRIDLAVETQYVLKELQIECGLIFNEVKDLKPITVTTWQSLALIPELFNGVNTVICDECHESKAKELQECLTQAGRNVPVRIGMTGTMPEPELHRNQIIAALGPIRFSKPAWELQETGFLATCFVEMWRFKDRKNPEYMKAQWDHEQYSDEIQWQATLEPRIGRLSDLITEIAQTGNTLILVRYKRYGEALNARILESIYLSGDDQSRVRVETYHEVNETDNRPLICTYGIASTGINIPRIFNLVLIEPGKEPIKLIQSIGRGLRKAKDKDHVNIFHICSDAGMAKRHVKEAQKIYSKHKYPFKITDIDY